MKKTTKIILLALAALFLLIGLKSIDNSKPYDELTGIKTVNGIISKLHCPPKGAASLSLKGSDVIFNLSVKFRSDYCDDKNAPVLVDAEITMKSVQVNGNFYQVYQITQNNKELLSPSDVESDQASSTFGLFLLSFLLIALVAFKSRPSANK